MTTIPIDRNELVRLLKLCFNFTTFATKIKYMMGAKPKMDAIPGMGFFKADCSGFIRWLIHGATHGKTTMPDGSYIQREWCQTNKFKAVSYLTAGIMDNKLRIAFIDPVGLKAGHVWLTINGLSIESYGGHGAGRRKWNTPILFNNVDYCFELTGELKP